MAKNKGTTPRIGSPKGKKEIKKASQTRQRDLERKSPWPRP
jgi:hypothetical protein